MDIEAAALGGTPNLRARPKENIPVDMSRALELPVADVFITHELYKRAPKKTDYLQEKLALQDLAARMADQPEEVLPRFVDLAMEMAGGVSAELSLYEESPSPCVFRWQYLLHRENIGEVVVAALGLAQICRPVTASISKAPAMRGSQDWSRFCLKTPRHQYLSPGHQTRDWVHVSRRSGQTQDRE
jgi:hypothetical protein